MLFSLSVQIRTREKEKTPEGKQLKHSPGFVPSVAHSQSSSGDFFIPQREEGFAPAGKMSSPPISRAAPPRGCWDLWRGLIRSDMAQNLQGVHLLAHSLCILSIRGMNCDNQSACACVYVCLRLCVYWTRRGGILLRMESVTVLTQTNLRETGRSKRVQQESVFPPPPPPQQSHGESSVCWPLASPEVSMATKCQSPARQRLQRGLGVSLVIMRALGLLTSLFIIIGLHNSNQIIRLVSDNCTLE